MKVIDLLNKIANGEELPKKIKFNHIEYHLIDDYYVDDEDGDLFIYIFKHNIDFSVNDEVKILDDEDEEKELPEKLKWNEKSQHNVVTDNTKKTLEHLLSRSEQLKKSINEIIDYLEKQRKGE